MEGFTTGTSFAWLRATNPARDILGRRSWSGLRAEVRKLKSAF